MKTEADAKEFSRELAWGCVGPRLRASFFPACLLSSAAAIASAVQRALTPCHYPPALTAPPTPTPRLRDPSGGEFAALQLWLPMERFEEALLLLGRTLGWSLLGARHRGRGSQGVAYPRWATAPFFCGVTLLLAWSEPGRCSETSGDSFIPSSLPHNSESITCFRTMLASV